MVMRARLLALQLYHGYVNQYPTAAEPLPFAGLVNYLHRKSRGVGI